MLEEYEEKISITSKVSRATATCCKAKTANQREEHVNEEMKQVVEAIEKLRLGGRQYGI